MKTGLNSSKIDCDSDPQCSFANNGTYNQAVTILSQGSTIGTTLTELKPTDNRNT